MATTQPDAVRVLTRLTDLDGLPRLTWTVRVRDGAELTGQPHVHRGPDGEAEGRAILQAWADHFEVPLVATEHETYTSLDVGFDLDGVPVRIFTHTHGDAR